MAVQYWATPVPPFHVADGTAVTGTVLTELSPTPQKVIPAPMLNDFGGKIIEFVAAGYYTTGATPGTYTFGLYLGTPGAIGSMGTVIAVSAALTAIASTTRAWRIEGEIQVRTVGGTGTAVAFGDISNFTTGQKDLFATASASTVAVDTTSAKAVALGVTPSVANSISCRYFNVKLWA
jgi:hypothetical protein